MKRLLSIASPSAAAILLRLTQLLILACIGNLSQGSQELGLVASFGVIAAIAVLAESGAVNFLLSSNRAEITQATFLRVASLQLLVALASSALAIGYCVVTFGAVIGDAVWLIVALSFAQAVDSVLRVVRAPFLLIGADHWFAAADGALAVIKCVVVVVAVLSRSLLPLLTLPIVSVVAAVIFWRAGRGLFSVGPSRPGVWRKSLGFGVSGASSALYSQAPLLIGATFLPLTAVAALSVAYRIVQPAEIIPATFSQQATPRLRAGRLRVSQLWGVFVGVGLLAGVVLWGLRPVIELLLGVTINPTVIFLVVLLSLPLKFGNYALTAGLYAKQLVRSKLFVTLFVGLLAVIATLLLSINQDAVQVASVTVASELLLALGLSLALKWDRRRMR